MQVTITQKTTMQITGKHSKLEMSGCASVRKFHPFSVVEIKIIQKLFLDFEESYRIDSIKVLSSELLAIMEDKFWFESSSVKFEFIVICDDDLRIQAQNLCSAINTCSQRVVIGQEIV